jgi:hypothetical protein
MSVDVRPDYWAPGQAPRYAVTRRRAAVLFLADDLAPVEASPSKRRQMAQDLCFAKWLVRRGLVNDKDQQP